MTSNLKLVAAAVGYLVCCAFLPPLLLGIPVMAYIAYRHRIRAAVDVHRFDRRMRKHKQLTR